MVGSWLQRPWGHHGKEDRAESSSWHCDILQAERNLCPWQLVLWFLFYSSVWISRLRGNSIYMQGMSSPLGWFFLEIAHKYSLWYIIPVPWVFRSVKMTIKINVWNVYCLDGQRNSLRSQQTHSIFCSWIHWVVCHPLWRDLVNVDTPSLLTLFMC